MTSKLTLSIEKKVIQKAKNYAYKNGKSLSKVVQHYLESITSEKSENIGGVNSKLEKLYGSVKIPVNLDHKKEFKRIISSKE